MEGSKTEGISVREMLSEGQKKDIRSGNTKLGAKRKHSVGATEKDC